MTERKEHRADCASLAGYGCTCAESEYQEWCIAEAARVEPLTAAWKARWPNHCPKCLGYGGHSFQQGHPYGSTTAYETLWDCCECIDNAKCPRCGHQHDEDWNGESCTACGWDLANRDLDSTMEDSCWCPSFEP